MLHWLVLAALAVMAGCVSAADAQYYTKDFETLSAAGNHAPYGIWSDHTTMWVLDNNDNKIYAYKMSDKSRDTSKEFDTLNAAHNLNPTGIWSDGTTMWVTDWYDDKIYAYKMSDKSRDTSKEFDTLSAAGNTHPYGIWSDRTTMWVADAGDDKIYAYKMSDKSRDSAKDFGLHAGNINPNGLWSDGTTMWVANSNVEKIYAYKMSDKTRDTSKEFDTLSAAGNIHPTGIWSDRTTMWVADHDDNKIYAYMMPSPSSPSSTPSASTILHSIFFAPPPPSDTTPPTVVSVERTGNATTTDRTLTWNVTFSEPVVVRADAHINYTSAANVTIPDLGAVHDTILVDVPGAVIGGSVSVDLYHPITSGLLIDLVAPDCTAFVLHNQTTTFTYMLREPLDLGDLAGVGAAGQWALHVSDHAKYWNGTLNTWSLTLESDGAIEGSGDKYSITRYVAGPGNHTLSLDGYDVQDRAGNHLADADPEVNEPYHVIGAAARTCQME